ncbi:MAG TPA: TIM barrel protein [Bryobacteraceae bacterium]|jgi:sugar phosphate isomerase/epimerase|nr:TIM barrel protein [Bryobacteraceae bacterium]
MMRFEVADAQYSRRHFLMLSACATAVPLRADLKAELKIGTMDTVLRLAGKPEALKTAKRLGLAAVQVTLGRSPDGKTLPLENAQLQQEYVSISRQQRIPIDSGYLDMLHVSCLKSDPNAGKWVAKGIDINKKLGAPILMTVFFSKCAVLNRSELDYVIDALRELTKVAEQAGVVLGFENTLSGEDNRYAVDRIASPAFKVWYDVGNSTYNGYDVPKEIRMLGRERICQFHFKDKGYLGEGVVRYEPILKAIDEIGFEGYANLETTSPSGNVERDTARNLTYLQNLMSKA